ncbi:MAG: class I SAM-dependent methyltransferase [Dissulfurispiraceae bacterium]|jgi:predicted O-methyltransferase YrrM|nr:class I SAM-dependent methyltransferase [Dissulfurispiraceae bacterium]
MMNSCNFIGNMQCPDGVDRVDNILEGYQRYQALLSALDLGLFEFLDKKKSGNRNEIAEGIGINGALSRDFLDLLVEDGFLYKDGEEYRNTRIAADFLLPSSMFYQGDVVRNLAKSSSWSDLSASLVRKELLQGAGGIHKGPSPSFISGLGQKALRGELQGVVKAISGWRGFKNARRILDVGGGHGLYTIALCQANPDLHGVVLDKAGVVETTRRYISDYGLEDRITVEEKDICCDSIDSGYDIVLISHLLYKFRKNLAAIFETVHASLKPGGLFVSNHWFCAPGCAAVESGVQALSKSLQSFGHPLCHEEKFDQLFVEKGFEIVTTTSAMTAFGPTRLQLAEKRKDLKATCGGCGR